VNPLAFIEDPRPLKVLWHAAGVLETVKLEVTPVISGKEALEKVKSTNSVKILKILNIFV